MTETFSFGVFGRFIECETHLRGKKPKMMDGANENTYSKRCGQAVIAERWYLLAEQWKMIKCGQVKNNCLDESALEIKVFMFWGKVEYSDMILCGHGTILISVLASYPIQLMCHFKIWERPPCGSLKAMHTKLGCDSCPLPSLAGVTRWRIRILEQTVC